MKFAMNGALTIGTLDGANVEIREAVGPENFFLFGLRADEVAAIARRGHDPRACYEASDELQNGDRPDSPPGCSRGATRSLFRPLVDALLTRDEYLVLADFEAYVACQETVGQTFRDVERWTRMSILNVARTGWFSSDRAIREYCEQIWRAVSVRIGG